MHNNKINKTNKLNVNDYLFSIYNKQKYYRNNNIHDKSS